MNLYEKVFRAFDKEGIRYIIVGGIAVNLYGYNRHTGDIDIVLALEKSNLNKIEKVMNELGYIPRLPIEVKELGNKEKLKKWMKEKGLKAYTFLSNTNQPQLDVDILVEDSLRFKIMDEKKTLIESWGIILPVVCIDDLIEMKRKANRDKDLLDLKALLELKSL